MQQLLKTCTTSATAVTSAHDPRLLLTPAACFWDTFVLQGWVNGKSGPISAGIGTVCSRRREGSRWLVLCKWHTAASGCSHSACRCECPDLFACLPDLLLSYVPACWVDPSPTDPNGEAGCVLEEQPAAAASRSVSVSSRHALLSTVDHALC